MGSHCLLQLAYENLLFSTVNFMKSKFTSNISSRPFTTELRRALCKIHTKNFVWKKNLKSLNIFYIDYILHNNIMSVLALFRHTINVISLVAFLLWLPANLNLYA